MSRMREAIRSGWKRSKSVQLLAGGGEHDRLAGDRRDGERGAAAGVAVELGEHDAVKPTPSWKARAVLTASWPIIASTTKRTSFGTIASRMSARLLHHLGVDAETAGGVDDHDVVELALGLLDAGAGDGDRVAGRVVQPVDAAPGCGAKTGTPARSPIDLELGDGVGALEVAGHQHRGCCPGP